MPPTRPKRTMSLDVTEERVMERALELYRRANIRHKENNQETPSVRAMCAVEVGEADRLIERFNRRKSS